MMADTIHHSFVEKAFNDFEGVEVETIALRDTHISRAVEFSDPIGSEAQQWQVYLNALSLLSFEEWLADRAPDISINWESSSIVQSQIAGLIKAVCNLRVGEFKVCLVTVGAVADEEIFLPRVAVELPDFLAHFYVAVQVIEDLQQAKIYGFLRGDQFIDFSRRVHLRPEPNWTYKIPLKWFDSNCDNLLLSLRCLKADAIPSPISIISSPQLLSQIQAKLKLFLPKLQADELNLWEVLDWEEAAVLFAHPELFEEIARVDSKDVTMLNVGAWLRDRLDELAQSLEWVLLPSFSVERLRFQAATAMRSPIEELDDILTQLERKGTNIPQGARGAYQNLILAEVSLRLYAVTWPLLSPENIPEWQLLLILGAPQSNSIPVGARLQISDNASVLGERIRTAQSDPPYLYARVAGTWEETFSVTITLGDEASVTLPPFGFRP